jgi:hypothetical protein
VRAWTWHPCGASEIIYSPIKRTFAEFKEGEIIAEGVVEKAIALALKADAGQVDEAGAAFILHPLRVMMEMTRDRDTASLVVEGIITYRVGLSTAS